jgi:hypothetical protein
MRKEYRIRDQAPPSEAETGRYRDFGRLVYQHERMTRPLYRRPLYKDPKTFLVILMIVLIAILVAEVVEKEKGPPVRNAPERGQQP